AQSLLDDEIDLIVVDGDADTGGALEVVSAAQSLFSPVPSIVMSDTAAVRDQARASGASEVVSNPPGFGELHSAVMRALGRPAAVAARWRARARRRRRSADEAARRGAGAATPPPARRRRRGDPADSAATPARRPRGQRGDPGAATPPPARRRRRGDPADSAATPARRPRRQRGGAGAATPPPARRRPRGSRAGWRWAARRPRPAPAAWRRPGRPR